MCGIAGIASFEKSARFLTNIHGMTNALRHRGPDDEGYVFFERGEGDVHIYGGEDTPRSVYDSGLKYSPLKRFAGQEHSKASLAFGHRRLSVIDLSAAGHQPMCSPDRRYWVVYNGEIYNYLELREELIRSGYVFSSGSDTEVLLNGYAHWGTEVLRHLIGMFAFAICDRRAEKLFLARDFFGIKPLYYLDFRKFFAFSSEIKGLLGIPGLERKASPHRVYEYLRYGLTDHGEDTLFLNIHQLPAAHYMVINLDGRDFSGPLRYWAIDLTKKVDIGFHAAADRLRSLFQENIRLHMRSDVPVGAALSGGIDSSSIVAGIRNVERSNFPLSTFTYVADDPKLCEEEWADAVGAVSSAIVHKVKIRADELASDLDQLVATQDEPFASTSIYAQERVFRLAKEHGIKVMLDGQGADELLGGYPTHVASRLASLLSQSRWLDAIRFIDSSLSMPLRDLVQLLARAGGLLVPQRLEGLARRLTGEDLMPAWLNEVWFGNHDVIPKAVQRLACKDYLRLKLHQTLVETSLPMLLRYEDRNSMASSIESRVPFLTPRLVSFVFELPEEYIIDRNGMNKAVFRTAMRGIVPDAVLDRRDKIGFETPERDWLTRLSPWVEEVLRSAKANEIPVLAPRELRDDWNKMLFGKRPFDSRIWRWINLIRWAECFHVDF